MSTKWWSHQRDRSRQRDGGWSHQRDGGGSRQRDSTGRASATLNKTQEQDSLNKKCAARTRRKATDPNHKPLVEFFCQEWEKHHANGTTTKYPFTAGKDAAAVTAILKAVGGDLARAKGVVSRFLDDDDKFLAKTGHTIAMMRTRLSAYLEKPNGAGNRTKIDSDDHYRDLLPT